jgi:hypothetical protein
VLPPPSRLGRGSRAPTQAPAAPAEEPKPPPKRQLTQPKPPPNGKNDAPNAIKAKLQSVENSLIKAKRSRKLFDREARAFRTFSAQHAQLARTSCPGAIQVPRSDCNDSVPTDEHVLVEQLHNGAGHQEHNPR